MIRFALPVLFEAVVRASLAACILGAGLRLLRVKNVRAQKAAWSIMLVAGIAMPLLMLSPWVPGWAEVRLPAALWSRIAHRPQAPLNTVHAASAPASALPTTEPDRISEISTTASLPPLRAPRLKSKHRAPAAVAAAPQTQSPAAVPLAPATGKNSRFPLDPFAVAWFVYLAVAIALVFRCLIGLASSIRLWLKAEPVAATALGVIDHIATRSSNRVFSPVSIGSGIVLPSDYGEWPPEKLRAVMAHEESHVRQGDFYWQLLAGFYAALTWFSPLGWWLKRKLSELSEAISDRAGLEESRSRSAYAQLLLEFAALPRPTLTGVAMARSNNLSHRIDRLLNESSFRQAFNGSRRGLIAAVVVPAVLVAATTLFRVEAAAAPGRSTSPQMAALSKDQLPSFSAVTGEPSPGPAQASDSNSAQTPAAPTAPSPAAAPSPAPEAAPAAPAPPMGFPAAGQIPAIPPIPSIDVHVDIPPMPPAMAFMQDFKGRASCYNDGDAYAIVGDPGAETRFCGSSRGEMEAEVEKARAIAHGHFLLFRHDGKYYVIDDPATVSQIEAMDQKVHDQGEQMRELGKQFRVEGEQIREAARQDREKAANIPAPDLSKEMAELNASVANLAARQGATVSREELQQVQREVSELQRRVFEAEFNHQFKAEMDLDMSKFKAQSDKFSEQMRQMGSQLGQTVQDNQQKIGSIIDDSLKSGKAKPVN